MRNVISDQELLRRARRFDSEALGMIYDRYSTPLYRYAVRLLGNPDSAEECVAEVFSRLLQALHRGTGPRDHLQAYLYRVAHNWITDQWRRQPPPAIELPTALSDHHHPDPLNAIGDPYDQERVRRALAYLTPDQRQVIVLKYIEEWENEQVAAALGKPVGAVKSLQHRALTMLRRVLKGEKNLDASE